MNLRFGFSWLNIFYFRRTATLRGRAIRRFSWKYRGPNDTHQKWIAIRWVACYVEVMTANLLLILAMLQVPAFSPNGTGVITGQIRAADGMPFSGVSVLVDVGMLTDGKTTIVPLG